MTNFWKIKKKLKIIKKNLNTFTNNFLKVSINNFLNLLKILNQILNFFFNFENVFKEFEDLLICKILRNFRKIKKILEIIFKKTFEKISFLRKIFEIF